MSDLNHIFHLKDKIKADLEVMRNCLIVEQKRIKNLKISTVKAMQYEQTAKLHDIEKKLTDVLDEVQNYLQ